MTIMLETTLDEALGINGCLALMWHDVLEGTHAELPTDTSDEVRQLIADMSFASFAAEKVSSGSDQVIRLLKLYDKTSNLLDASHFSKEKWNSYLHFTQSLIADVEKNFGQLNNITIARAIAVTRL